MIYWFVYQHFALIHHLCQRFLPSHYKFISLKSKLTVQLYIGYCMTGRSTSLKTLIHTPYTCLHTCIRDAILHTFCLFVFINKHQPSRVWIMNSLQWVGLVCYNLNTKSLINGALYSSHVHLDNNLRQRKHSIRLHDSSSLGIHQLVACSRVEGRGLLMHCPMIHSWWG